MCGGGPVTSFKVNFQGGGDQHVLSGGGGGGGGVHLFTKGVESIAKR